MVVIKYGRCSRYADGNDVMHSGVRDDATSVGKVLTLAPHGRFQAVGGTERSLAYGGQVVGGAALPFHQEQGRVVSGRATTSSRQCMRQGPDHLLRAASGAVGALHEADKALLAELLFARPVHFDGSSGVYPASAC
jgi:hypothetical protein